MTTQIVFHCAQCDQKESLSLEEFRLTGYPICPFHKMRMEAKLPDDEISQAVNDAMRAMTRLTVVALRGTSGATSVSSKRE